MTKRNSKRKVEKRVGKALKTWLKTKTVTRNPKIKLPAHWTPAEIRVNEKGDPQIRINPAKVGTGRNVKGVKSVQNA